MLQKMIRSDFYFQKSRQVAVCFWISTVTLKAALTAGVHDDYEPYC